MFCACPYLRVCPPLAPPGLCCLPCLSSLSCLRSPACHCRCHIILELAHICVYDTESASVWLHACTARQAREERRRRVQAMEGGAESGAAASNNAASAATLRRTSMNSQPQSNRYHRAIRDPSRHQRKLLRPAEPHRHCATLCSRVQRQPAAIGRLWLPGKQQRCCGGQAAALGSSWRPPAAAFGLVSRHDRLACWPTARPSRFKTGAQDPSCRETGGCPLACRFRRRCRRRRRHRSRPPPSHIARLQARQADGRPGALLPHRLPDQQAHRAGRHDFRRSGGAQGCGALHSGGSSGRPLHGVYVEGSFIHLAAFLSRVPWRTCLLRQRTAGRRTCHVTARPLAARPCFRCPTMTGVGPHAPDRGY